MKLTKRLLALTLALVLALSLAACGGNNNTASPDSNNTAADSQGGGDTPAPAPTTSDEAVYRTLYSGEVTTLNYLITGQTNELSLCFNMVDCLVEYDSYGNVEPALATSWEQNDDATVWTFHIREGVKWVDKDGNEVADVTANDWVSSVRYASDANNASGTFYQISNIVGASEYYDYTAYLLALETAVDGTDESGNAVKLVTNSDGEQEVLEEVPEAKLEDIGAKALDDYTLEFTLNAPCPYFISTVSFGPYMPVYGPFLEEQGSKFGTDNASLLYNGAFILTDYQPQVQRVLTKNQSYWEKDCVYLDAIRMTYNAEASSIGPTMYMSGDIDYASIGSDLLSAMMDDPQYASKIHSSRVDNSYSYWYLFNFDPQFDAEYEPDNWNLAVNNENFRQSVVHAFNRIPALAANDNYDPLSLKSNTITPAGFATSCGDFTSFGDLPTFTDEYYFNEALAKEYKEKAVEELTAAGATFPVKMLMRYNPTVNNWANECQVVEQQIESVLGADYIDIIIQAGPETGFLAAVRQAGDYAFMKCNWGADYADPETWTDPFSETSKYNYIYRAKGEETKALYAEYIKLVSDAKAITNDMEARYEAFAKAESFLLSHGFAIPIHINSRAYQMSNLNLFEGQYASFGMASQRYKDQHLYDTSMSLDEFQVAYSEWLAKMEQG